MTPSIGEDFVRWRPPTGGDETLGLVDFSIFPHLDHEDLPDNTMANAEKWAAGMPVPAYAIDDETAIKVIDGAVEVVSEGHWKLFTPKHVEIRPEAIGDRAAVRAVQLAAFGADHVPVVANLVDELRDAVMRGDGLSLVAEDGDQLVGHAMFSPSLLDAPKRLLPCRCSARSESCQRARDRGSERR